MKKELKELWDATFGKLQNQFIKYLCQEIDESCRSVLDVGCGFNSPVQQLFRRPKVLVGVDGFGDAIKKARAKCIHDDYREYDVRRINEIFPQKSFDCVLASDLIEHLTKEDGFKLIYRMERIAIRKVIIYTPNGFLPQRAEYGNVLQEHRSGWTVKEMRKLGV